MHIERGGCCGGERPGADGRALSRIRTPSGGRSAWRGAAACARRAVGSAASAGRCGAWGRAHTLYTLAITLPWACRALGHARRQ